MSTQAGRPTRRRASKWSDLPDNARRYRPIDPHPHGILQTPIDMVSVGPHREQTILLRDPFNPVPQQVERLVHHWTGEG